MAIDVTVAVLQTALWPQGDIRDPLGIWGFRRGVTGDGTGGSIKVSAFVPLLRTMSYLYTAYSLNFLQLTGTPTQFLIKARLLTNWPNIDPAIGIQGYSTFIALASQADTDFTAPILGPGANLLGPLDRFLLLFDPRSRTTNLNIVEVEAGLNTDLATYSAAGYGYFWDRSVLDAPGGPRHPGAS